MTRICFVLISLRLSASKLVTHKDQHRRVLSLATGGFNDVQHGLDHIRYILFRHPGIEWQGNDPFEGGAGLREVLRAVAKSLPVIRMQMQGNEMDASAEVVLLEQMDEFVAGEAQSL